MDAARAAAARLYQNPDTRRAGGLAAAVMGGNVAALGFTVVFARMLGEARYGSLAALVSTFVILMVPGSALQTTVAREVSAAAASGDPAAGAGVRRWLSRLVLMTVGLTALSALARAPIAAAIGVEQLDWAAAGALPAGCMWLIVSVQRGALQGFQRYRVVGISIVAEQTARLGFGLVLVAAGLGVTGAYLGTPLSLAAIALWLALPLHEELSARSPRTVAASERLRDLVRRAGWPVLALALIAWLQDGHVIIVKHVASSHAAGAWGAAAVAAKAIMWVATGLALYVVPEAARRARVGGEARTVLGLAVGIIGVIAFAMVSVYALGAHQLLRAVFKVSASAGALPFLALAMSALALTYLAAQYQLALHRVRFIAVLAVAALIEPAILVAIGPHLTSLALGLLALQAAVAITLLGLAARAVPRLAPAQLEQAAPALTEA